MSSSTMRFCSRNCCVIGVRGYGVGMLNVRPVDVRLANSRFVSIDSRVSSGLPTMRPPTTNRPCRWRWSMASMVAFPRILSAPAPGVFRSRLQEIEIAFEDVLDPEKDVAESGALHQRRKRRPVLRKRRSHRLHDILDVVEPAIDDGLAEQLEAAYVERDVVVDEEDGPCAAASRIDDVGNHPLDRVDVKVAAAHLDDRAEAAVVRAAPRCFDDIDLAPQQRVAVEDARGAVGQPKRVRLETGDRPLRPMDPSARRSRRQTPRLRAKRSAGFQRTQQVAEGLLAFSAHQKIDVFAGLIGRRSEARIVSASDNARVPAGDA